MSGVRFKFAAGQRYGRAELYIDCGDKAKNKFIFNHLHSKKEKIETDLGGSLVWEQLDENRACKVETKEIYGNVFERDKWDEMIDSMTDAMCCLEKAIKEPMSQVLEKVKNGAKTT